MPSLHIQTRALIQRKTELEAKLESSGFQKQKVLTISDSYYTNSTDFDPELHTYEKTGESVRIRRSDGTIRVEKQTAATKKDESRYTHDAIQYETLYEGDETHALEMAHAQGYGFHLIDIEKTRTVYTHGTDRVFLDVYGTLATIIEVDSEVETSSEYDRIKNHQLELLNSLDIPDHSVISDGYIHRRITALIESDPKLRKEMLQKDLEYLIRVLREKEIVSGEAYTDTGDGWHENPTYETLYHDILLLNRRIIDVKEDLAKL